MPPLLHIAPSRTVLLEVANPSDSPIHLPAHAILGTWMALHKDHLEPTLDSRDSHAQPDIETSSSTTDEPRRVLTQIGGPGVVCPVQSETTSTKELPIDSTESSLSIDQRELLRKTLVKFSDIFVDSSKAPGRTHLIEFSIDTGNKPPIRSVPYRTSKAEGDIMEAERIQYLDLGLIRPSKSPWSSPMLMIRKPDGSIRFCIDYRKLNSVTVKDSYPMPRIDDLLDVLGRAKLFSTMDIASGYWNVPMAKIVPRRRHSHATGTLPNPEKIKSVLRVKALKDASEVRAFLRLAGYFRRFVHDFSKIAAPLTNLLTAEQFIWSTACDKALESLKRSRSLHRS
ncbi:hypothetical protein Ae201684P_018782 [Aphanomyces euteiches]|nr:hypothetical protein Ae201684P_018782 [Aphanomyces euteiches]